MLLIGPLDSTSKEGSIKTQVDSALQSGWCIVAGTTSIQSIEYVPDPSEKVQTTPKGTAFRTMMSIVLEKK